MKALLPMPGYSDLHVSMPTVDHIFMSLIIPEKLFSSCTATILPSEVSLFLLMVHLSSQQVSRETPGPL